MLVRYIHPLKLCSVGVLKVINNMSLKPITTLLSFTETTTITEKLG